MLLLSDVFELASCKLIKKLKKSNVFIHATHDGEWKRVISADLVLVDQILSFLKQGESESSMSGSYTKMCLCGSSKICVSWYTLNGIWSFLLYGRSLHWGISRTVEKCWLIVHKQMIQLRLVSGRFWSSWLEGVKSIAVTYSFIFSRGEGLCCLA